MVSNFDPYWPGNLLSGVWCLNTQYLINWPSSWSRFSGNKAPAAKSPGMVSNTFAVHTKRMLLPWTAVPLGPGSYLSWESRNAWQCLTDLTNILRSRFAKKMWSQDAVHWYIQVVIHEGRILRWILSGLRKPNPMQCVSKTPLWHPPA